MPLIIAAAADATATSYYAADADFRYAASFRFADDLPQPRRYCAMLMR